MHGWGAILGAIDVELTLTEVDGIPPQGHKLADSQPVPIGNQDHGGVAMTVAVVASGDDQAVDLGAGQILSSSDVGVTLAGWGLGTHCPIIGSWGHQGEVRFSHVFQCSCKLPCPINSPTLDMLREGART